MIVNHWVNGFIQSFHFFKLVFIIRALQKIKTIDKMTGKIEFNVVNPTLLLFLNFWTCIQNLSGFTKDTRDSIQLHASVMFLSIKYNTINGCQLSGSYKTFAYLNLYPRNIIYLWFNSCMGGISINKGQGNKWGSIIAGSGKAHSYSPFQGGYLDNVSFLSMSFGLLSIISY